MAVDATAISNISSASSVSADSWFAGFNFMTIVYIILALVALFILFKLGMFIYHRIKHQKEVDSLKKDLMVRRVLSKLSKGGSESESAKSELNLKLALIDLQFKQGLDLIEQQQHTGKKNAWFILLGEPSGGKTTLLEHANCSLVCSNQTRSNAGSKASTLGANNPSYASFGIASVGTSGAASGVASSTANGLGGANGLSGAGAGNSGFGGVGGAGTGIGAGTALQGTDAAAHMFMSQGTTGQGTSTLNPPNLADETSPAVQFYVGRNQVILDVSGEVFFDHWAGGSSAEYAHICKLIKQKHYREPLRGIILCIPADALLADDSKLTQKKALLMVEELWRLTSSLSQYLPCYIVITKLDVVLGFREYFAELSNELKDQAVGVFNPYGEQFEPALIEQFFAKFIQQLREGTYALFSSKEVVDLSYQGRSRLDKSAGIYLFAQNFAKLQNNLILYLNTIFAPQTKNYAFFRGLFFTSAQDDGYCLDSNFAYLAHQSIDEAVFIDANYLNSRDFFIRGALAGQIFKDEPCNHFNHKAQARRDIPRYVAAACCSLLSVYFLYGVLFAAPHFKQILANDVVYYTALNQLFANQTIERSPLLGLTPYNKGAVLFDLPMPHDSTISRLTFFSENQSHLRQQFILPFSLLPGAIFSMNLDFGSNQAERGFIYNQLQTNMAYLPLVRNVERALLADQDQVTALSRNALFALMSIALYRDLNTQEQSNDSYAPHQAQAMMNYLYPQLTTNIRNELLFFIPEYDWYSQATNNSIILDDNFAAACRQGLRNWEQHWLDLSNYPESRYQKLKEDIEAAEQVKLLFAEFQHSAQQNLLDFTPEQLYSLNAHYQNLIRQTLRYTAQIDDLLSLLWLEYQQQHMQSNSTGTANSMIAKLGLQSAAESAAKATSLTIQEPTDFKGGTATAFKTTFVPSINPLAAMAADKLNVSTASTASAASTASTTSTASYASTASVAIGQNGSDATSSEQTAVGQSVSDATGQNVSNESNIRQGESDVGQATVGQGESDVDQAAVEQNGSVASTASTATPSEASTTSRLDTLASDFSKSPTTPAQPELTATERALTGNLSDATFNASDNATSNATVTAEALSQSSELDQYYADYFEHLRYDFAFLRYFNQTRQAKAANSTGIYFGGIDFTQLIKQQPALEQALAQDYLKLKTHYMELKQSPLFSPHLALQGVNSEAENATNGSNSQRSATGSLQGLGKGGLNSSAHSSAANSKQSQSNTIALTSASLQELMSNVKLNYLLFAQMLNLCLLPEDINAFHQELQRTDTLQHTFELLVSSRSQLQNQQQRLHAFLDKYQSNAFIQSAAPIAERIINLNQQALVIACYDKMLSFYPQGNSETEIMGQLSRELADAPFALHEEQPLYPFEYDEILGTTLNLRREYNPGRFISYIQPLLYIGNWLKQHGGLKEGGVKNEGNSQLKEGANHGDTANSSLAGASSSSSLASALELKPHQDGETSACEDVYLIVHHMQQHPRLAQLYKVFSSYASGMINYYAQMADYVRPNVHAYNNFHQLAQQSRAYEINDKLHSLYELSLRTLEGIDDALLSSSAINAKKQAAEHLTQRLSEFSIKLNDDCSSTLTAWSMLPTDAISAANLIETNPQMSQQLWGQTLGHLPWWNSFTQNGRKLLQSEAIEQGTMTVDALMERLNAFPPAKDAPVEQALNLEELNSLYAAFKFLGLKAQDNPLSSLQSAPGGSSTGLDGLSGAAQQLPGLVKSPGIKQQIVKQSALSPMFLQNLEQILSVLCAKHQMGFELFVPNAAKQNQLYKHNNFNLPLATLTYRYISAQGEVAMQQGARISSAQSQNRKLYSGLVFDQSLTLSFYEYSSDTKPQAQFTLYHYPALQMYLNASTLYDAKERKAYVPLTITSNKGSFIFFIGLEFDQDLPTPENWPSSADFKVR